MTNLDRRISKSRTYALGTALLTSSMAGCAAPVNRTVWLYDQQPRTTVNASAAQFGTITQIEIVATEFGVSGTVAGAAAGALIGNQLEQQQARAASEQHYRVLIEFDDGHGQSYNVGELNGLRSGERVKLESGQISAAAL